MRLRFNAERSGDTNTGTGGPATQEFGGPHAVRGGDYVANWTTTLSARSLNDLRLSFNDRIVDDGCNYAQNNPPGSWFTRNYTSGALLGCPRIFGSTGEDQLQIIDNYSLVSGRHEWKAGLQIYRNRVSQDLTDNGRYTFSGNAAYPFDLGNANTYPDRFIITQGVKRYDVPSWSYGFFIQDSWRLRPDATLNVGLRYDVDGSLSALNELVRPGPVFHETDKDVNNLAPRAGFAWTPFGSRRRTVLRAGAGMYYDQHHNLTAANSIINGLLLDQSLFIDANNPLANPFWPDVTRARRFLAEALAANRIPDASLLPAALSFVAQVDRDLAIPYTVQVSGGLGHEFGRALSFTADYVYSRGLDQFISRDINLDPVTFQRINPLYLGIVAYGNEGYIIYHGLQTQVNWTLPERYLLKLSYTLATTRSNTSTLLGTFPTATNPFDYSEDEGPNDNDVRNTLSVNGSVALPWGVQASGILSYSSPLPYSATTTARRPDGKSLLTWWPLGRNSLRGDDYVSLDIRAGKTFRLGERIGLTGFAELFNLTNAVNYTTFVSDVAAANFGQPQAALPKRRMQLGFRVDF